MIFGYARVSTDDQNLDLQLDALKKYGCETIFKEKTTGTKAERPELNELLKRLREGDQVVVYKLDRISRSTKHLIELSEHFSDLGVEFISIKENLDTTNAVGKAMFKMLAVLSEMERDLISERTKAGLESARSRGRLGGRPPKDKKKIDLAVKMYKSKSYSLAEITEATGVSKGTIYNYLKKETKK